LPQLPGKMALAVMYFDNQSASPDLDWLREGLADMLITNLSRSKRLSVLGRQQFHLLLERMGHRQADAIGLDDAVEIGRRSQAEAIVLGSFARFGEKIRINVQLYGVQTAQPLASESIVADRPDDILHQIDLLSLKLASHLGAAPDEQEDKTTLAGVMTNNLDAYRYYSLAMEEIQMFQFPEAIEMFEKASQLDPQFAMAYARIGYIYAVRWGPKEKAKPYLEKAFQMSDRLTEKDRLYITAWHANANADPTTAIETYQKMIVQYPMEVEGYQRLCWLLIAQRRMDEALLTIKQGLIIDPESKDLYNGLGSVYYYLNKYEEAIAAYQHYVQLAPADPNALDSLGTCHQAFGRYDLALDAYQRALSINPESRVAIIHLGNAYFQQGRYRAALEQYQRHLQVARDDSIRARSYDSMAQVYLKWGDLNRAETAARQATRYTKAPVWSDLLVALAQGDHQRAEKLKNKFLANLSHTYLLQRGWLKHYHYFVGYLALEEGRTAEALEHFKEAQQHNKLYWNIDPFEDCLANAYLELGRFDEAIAEYERLLSSNPNYPLAHYHLAQAYERKGEPDQARAAYLRFLEVWKHADPDIPAVIAARQRLSSQ
jgi:tetratricopeptide (TPR) repeat protein